MRNKLVRKTVTNEEFQKALENEDNKKIIKTILSKYYTLIPAEDLKSCGYEALWRCLGYHKDGNGNKFTTSLWRFTKWECLRALKRIRKQHSHKVINISAIETKKEFEIPSFVDNPDITHLRECIELLNSVDKALITEYYFERRTMEEIGNLHGYSKEAARQKINKAEKELRKIYLGV